MDELRKMGAEGRRRPFDGPLPPQVPGRCPALLRVRRSGPGRCPALLRVRRSLLALAALQMGGGVRGGAGGTREGLSGGGERHRQRSWPDHSWQVQYADLHRSILAGSAPAGARRYLVWTCGTTFREPGCDLRSRACNCVGYANRLLGLVSAFLAAIITSRAFLIAWPGEEAVHLHNFFHSDLIDWRTTDEVMHRLGMPASLEFVQHDWAKHDLLQLLNGEYGEVLLIGAEKGDFLDIFRHGHHAEHLAQNLKRQFHSGVV